MSVRIRAFGVALVLSVAAPAVLLGAPVRAAPGSQCLSDGAWAGDAATADDVLARRLTFSPHPTANLSHDPTWEEDPFGDRNWRHQLNSLMFARNLWQAWEQTGDTRFRDDLGFLLRDWFEDNYRLPMSDFGWNPQTTAWRAMVYACAAEHLPAEQWLTDALDFHARVLADEGFYVRNGNPALNQNLGLLAIACERGRTDLVQLAESRLRDLAVRSIDEQGVTNEQAVEYQLYNYNRYGEAIARLQACGRTLPQELTSRRDLMPNFLAHATLPNREYELIGDSHAHPAPVIPGTPAEFAATGGASGPKPGATWATYAAGFAFGRTGWGETRPFADETFYSARYGPARIHHGHFDGGAVTLYGYGSRLLVDSGFDRYEFDGWLDYFRSPAAHNVVTVEDSRFSRTAPTWLSGQRHRPAFDFLYLRNAAWRGVLWKRRVVFSRAGGYMLVEDLITSRTRTSFRQLWHLPADAAPIVGGRTARTARQRGNVTLRWLGTAPVLRIVRGRQDPLQGWVAFRYGETVAAPVLQATIRGTAAHYVTLIVPSEAAAPQIAVSGFQLGADGFRGTFTVGAHADRVIVRGNAGSVVPVTAGP